MDIVKMSDFFNSFQMLRFNKQAEYRTFTGGIVSIGIIVTIIVAFASMIGQTINRTIISYTFNQQRGYDPALSTFTASADDNFMIAAEVSNYDFNSTKRYFDIVLVQLDSYYAGNYTEEYLPLQPCTRQHWAMLPDLVEKFDKIKAQTWACPTIGTIIKLKGKFTSQQLLTLQFILMPCKNSTDLSRPCATPQEIDIFIDKYWLSFNLLYVNSVINADQPDYKMYYLQDRNYIPFDQKNGGGADLYLTQIQINSDNSIWPFQDILQETILSIPFSPIFLPHSVQKTQVYAQFTILKDYARQTYERQVQKIFVVFSFMGGLIGAIMACLFIMNTYTSFAFELALALQVFKGEKSCKTFKKQFYGGNFSFNLLHFFKYLLYTIVKKFKDINSPLYDHMNECRDEIVQQLDIKNLIKRIIFLEYSISFIFEDYQLFQLQEQKPFMPHQIKRLRKKIQFDQPTKEDQLEKQDTNKQFNSIQKKSSQKYSQKDHIPNGGGIQLKNPSPQIIILEDTINCVQGTNRNPSKMYLYEDKKCSKNQLQNIKKLTISAKEGNIVSKRLLQVINSQKNKEKYQFQSKMDD